MLDVVPGHGRDNLQLEVGHASVTSASREDVVTNALAALAAGGDTASAYSARDGEFAFSSALAELDLAGPVPGEVRGRPAARAGLSFGFRVMRPPPGPRACP